MPLAGIVELIELAEMVRRDSASSAYPRWSCTASATERFASTHSFELAGSIASDVVERLWLPRSGHLVAVDVEHAQLCEAVVRFSDPARENIDSNEHGKGRLMNERLVLAIDQGTTGTTVLLLDEAMEFGARATTRSHKAIPRPARSSTIPKRFGGRCCRRGPGARAAPAGTIAGIGVTNQRETVVMWERATGRAVAPAIVWQDRRTARRCEAMRKAGHEPLVQRTTGLLLDPYFSGTKIAWMLENLPGLPATRRSGRHRLWHRRQLSRVAPLRRQKPRHGRLERLAHLAARPGSPRMER